MGVTRYARVCRGNTIPPTHTPLRSGGGGAAPPPPRPRGPVSVTMFKSHVIATCTFGDPAPTSTHRAPAGQQHRADRADGIESVVTQSGDVTRKHEPTRLLRVETSTRPRIIPACAGNTHSSPSSLFRIRDHPRMRGEHQVEGISRCAVRGSSPHARGTRCHSLRDAFGEGIIPACAGNTQVDQVFVALYRDHPRMRGEHTGFVATFSRIQGSSPHARGTRLHSGTLHLH